MKFVDKTSGLSYVNMVTMVMMRAPALKAGKDFVNRALFTLRLLNDAKSV